MTAQGIILEIAKIPVSANADGLKSFKRKLIAAYFQNIDESLVLQEIASELFSEFPQLQHVLHAIFSTNTHPGNIIIPADLLDWDKPVDYPEQNFLVLNSKYGYFSDEVLEKAEAIFNALQPLCRKMICLVERQADDVEIAYKLMALFCVNEILCSPVDIDKCIKEIAAAFVKFSQPIQDKKPYHDVFVAELQAFPDAEAAKDIKAWHSLMKAYGYHALPFFADCQSFDAVPKTLQEAKNIQIKKIYPRAAENYEFARFCKAYRIDTESFNAGLNFIQSGWPKKELDNLPLVDIRRIEGKNEYRCVKLPPGDLRALYLGNMIPGCCQFINGHSRQCVIDGTSLTDNGFYVLLKKKIKTVQDECKEDASSSLEMDGDIIAQSYAWISRNGNLCLDSIEWDSARVTETILKDIMGQFSAHVLQEYRQIHYVNVGVGGQTPDNFAPRAIISEQLRQGKQYGDSSKQYCLASRAHPEQIERLQTKLQEFDEELRQNFLYLSAYFESIDAIVNIEEIERLLTLAYFKPFPAINKTLTASDFRLLTFAQYQQLP